MGGSTASEGVGGPLHEGQLIALVSVEVFGGGSQAVGFGTCGWGACTACSSAGHRSSTPTSVISASKDPGSASAGSSSNCRDTGRSARRGDGGTGTGSLGVRRAVRSGGASVRRAGPAAGWASGCGGPGWAECRGLGAVGCLALGWRRGGSGRRRDDGGGLWSAWGRAGAPPCRRVAWMGRAVDAAFPAADGLSMDTGLLQAEGGLGQLQSLAQGL